MIIGFYRKEDKFYKSNDISELRDRAAQLLWLDLIAPTPEELVYFESLYHVPFQSQQEIEEIELSSRYLELGNSIFVNTDFLTLQEEQFTHDTISFILLGNLLISRRQREVRAFDEVVKRMELNPRLFQNGYQIITGLFEARIDQDADLVELVARQISSISRQLSVEKDLGEDMILKITRYQETTMTIRQSIIDKQRVISAMLKSERFPKESVEKLRIMIKDINSLVDHTAFSFERLEYLQNTFLGLLNIEQNNIIKIFTVVSVIFLPPTLIASIYGMNFRVLPELNWTAGYPFALLLMVISSVGTLYLFRKKKWL